MSENQYSSDICTFKTVNRYPAEKADPIHLQSRSPKTTTTEYNEETAVLEAQRCLVFNNCTSCDLCRYLCPDLCISRNPDSGLIEIDYNYCKGCGICAYICPKGAISMVQEE